MHLVFDIVKSHIQRYVTGSLHWIRQLLSWLLPTAGFVILPDVVQRIPDVIKIGPSSYEWGERPLIAVAVSLVACSVWLDLLLNDFGKCDKAQRSWIFLLVSIAIFFMASIGFIAESLDSVQTMASAVVKTGEKHIDIVQSQQFLDILKIKTDSLKKDALQFVLLPTLTQTTVTALLATLGRALQIQSRTMSDANP